ncbi:MAG: hypothetical protein JXQ87_18300 [Bacteroidia bacterium]
MGAVSDGHLRNAANRRTIKEVTQGRFERDRDSLTLRELPKEYLEKRKLTSEYRSVSDLPFSRWKIFLIVSALFFAIYFFMFGW